MSYVKDGVFHVQPTPDDQCQLCGGFGELRPYGPNGEEICFTCGMNTPEARKTTEAHMDRLLGAAHTETFVVNPPLTVRRGRS